MRDLGVEDLALLGGIDGSEDVVVEYAVDGRLTDRPPAMKVIPSRDDGDTGPFSVAHQVAFCRRLLDDGATFLGAFDGAQNFGLAVVEPALKPGLANPPHPRLYAAEPDDIHLVCDIRRAI